MLLLLLPIDETVQVVKYGWDFLPGFVGHLPSQSLGFVVCVCVCVGVPAPVVRSGFQVSMNPRLEVYGK